MGGNRSSPRARRGWSIALATLGAILALVGGVMLYASENLFDHDAVADRAESALEDERVRLAIAQPITDAILDSGPATLVNGRPLIESVTTGALATPPVRAAVHEAVKTLAAKLFDRDPDVLVLNLATAATLASQALEAVDPKLARRLPARISDVRIEVTASVGPIDSLQLADDVRIAGVLLPPLAALLLVASVAIAPDRRRATVRASLAVAAAAGFGVVALAIGEAVLVGSFDDDLVADAVAGAWDVLLGDLSWAFLFAGVLALVLAAAARFTAGAQFDPFAPFVRAGELLRRRPANVALGLLRAVVLGALGIALILEPELSLETLAVIGGAWVLYVGVGELLAIVAPPREGAAEEERPRVRPARLAAVGGAIGAVALGAALLAGGGSANERPSGPPPACNGYPQLCHKRIDQVTFPATHNSMSAAELPGWFLTNQRFGISRQLDDGIRGLLIDTHYGIRRGKGRGLAEVITDLQKEGKTREEIIDEIGEDGLAAAEDLVGKIAFSGTPGESEPYLCHVLCELGATPLDAGLAEIADWMRTHPDEFLVIFVEDVVSLEETAAAFERTGLLRWAYVPDHDLLPPTLGELIARDERLFVLAENDGGGGKYPWYQEGFDFFQETPYTFNSVPEIEARRSCRPNRGSVRNPLFLMNSWIEKIPRDPDLAERIDARDALMERVRTCEKVRGLRPNLIAVDYYDHGDVVTVAKELNGIPAGESPSVRTTP